MSSATPTPTVDDAAAAAGNLLQRWLKASKSCPSASYEKNREKSFAVKA